MESIQLALAQMRPSVLGGATDDELRWLWRKLDQWHALAKDAGADTTEHEVAAGFLLQEAEARSFDLVDDPTDGELPALARARCHLSARLALLPNRIVLSDSHVQLRRKDGGLEVVSTGEPLQCAAPAVAAMRCAGVPARAGYGLSPPGAAVPLYDVALVRSGTERKCAPDAVALTKAQVHDGAIVRLAVPGLVRDAIGQAGLLVSEVNPDDLHVTLLYLGAADDLDADTREAIVERVTAVCAEHRPIQMRVTGAGYFAPAGDGGAPVYLTASGLGLSLLRADLERAIGGVIDLPTTHGFVPHVTLGYWPEGEAPELPDLTALELPGWTASNVEMVAADALLAVCPFTGRDPRVSPGWAEPAEPEPTTQATRIACSEDDRQIIYYLVSEPNTVDAHGHRISAQEVEDALHGYMAGERKVKLEHGKVQGLVHKLGRTTPGKAIVVEGFVAPQELAEFHGAKPPDGPIAKGSSIVGIHYTDPELWRELKATDHGISWGGYARKVKR